MAGAVILFGLLMGLRSHLHSAWLRDGAAGAAFAILLGAMAQFRKSKANTGTQRSTSPNGDQPKPPADSGVSKGPPSVS
jgi:hypothetical protein